MNFRCHGGESLRRSARAALIALQKRLVDLSSPPSSRFPCRLFDKLVTAPSDPLRLKLVPLPTLPTGRPSRLFAHGA